MIVECRGDLAREIAEAAQPSRKACGLQSRGMIELVVVERQYQREAYLGLPCHDSQGQVIGHIACADPGSMPDELPHQAILRIFAVRASMELVSAFAEQGGKRLAVSGTGYEYDCTRGHCSEYSTPTVPQTVYGSCKLALNLLDRPAFAAFATACLLVQIPLIGTVALLHRRATPREAVTGADLRSG